MKWVYDWVLPTALALAIALPVAWLLLYYRPVDGPGCECEPRQEVIATDNTKDDAAATGNS